jgi:hypothetical protein
LIEPEGAARYAPMEEHFLHIGLGTPDVTATTRELEKHGIEFLITTKSKKSAISATTASTYTTPTTCKCPPKPLPNAPSGPPNGSAKRYCGAPCPSPTRNDCAMRPEDSDQTIGRPQSA